MKLRRSLVHPHTNTTRRSVGSFEAVSLEKNETRKGAFLGRKFKKSTHPPPWAFFFSVPLGNNYRLPDLVTGDPLLFSLCFPLFALCSLYFVPSGGT
jgi:hypothetical protein